VLAVRVLWADEGWDIAPAHPQWGPVFGPKRLFERGSVVGGGTPAPPPKKTMTGGKPGAVRLDADLLV
jgi:hypothetical protein